MKNLIPGQVSLAAQGWLSQSRDGKGAEGDQAWRGRWKQPREKGGWTISQSENRIRCKAPQSSWLLDTFLEKTEIPLGLKKAQPSLTRPKRTLPEKAGENPWVSTKMKSPTSGEAICIPLKLFPHQACCCLGASELALPSAWEAVAPGFTRLLPFLIQVTTPSKRSS